MNVELYQSWLRQAEGSLRAELEAIAQNPAEINDRFYRELEFGTAGLRGILGAGTNRMNRYTVGRATQGLADTLENRRVAIAYDCRNGSAEFARLSAAILAENGVQVYLYPELMPTPMLSYAVRYFGCGAGIMITASHNSAEYNGFKCYGPDGCQMTEKAAAAVYAAMQRIDYFTGVRAGDYDELLAAGKISLIEPAVIETYYDAVRKQAICPEIAASAGLKVLYTPLYGTGNKPVRTVLAQMGYGDVTVVPSQEQPNGDFPTAPSPNPENAGAYDEAFALAKSMRPDLILATDPDCDRVGIALPEGDGWKILTGNQLGCLLLHYVLSRRKAAGTLPQRPVAVKSVVTTPMAAAIAADFGCEMRNVLTGFKYIGEQIGLLEAAGEAERFVFGFEESSGFLAGTHARDKDAVVASMLICEMAAVCRSEGKTLLQVLEELYARYGAHYSRVTSTVFPGQAGAAEMAAFLENLRAEPPAAIGGVAVTARLDYRSGKRVETATGAASEIGLPPANMLVYELGGAGELVVRPSGTEPKLKIYYATVAPTMAEAEAVAAKLEAAMTARL